MLTHVEWQFKDVLTMLDHETGVFFDELLAHILCLLPGNNTPIDLDIIVNHAKEFCRQLPCLCNIVDLVNYPILLLSLSNDAYPNCAMNARTETRRTI